MMNDTKRKAEIITAMFILYGQGGDGERIAGYVKTFKDVPVNLLEVACRKATLQTKFVPSISEIVEAMRSLIGSVDEKRRMKTWDEAQKEISDGISRSWFKGCLGEISPDDPEYGKSCDPMWSTPEIKAAVDSYGFSNLGKTMESDMPIVWSQLRKAYEQACNRRTEKTVNAYVIGGNNGKLAQMVKGLSDKMLLGSGNG